MAMLETRFPRPPGDVGHPDAFGVPVRQVVVAGAVPRAIVTDADALRGSPLVPAFRAALQQLADAGAAALTTSCGFLVLLQHDLQASVPVPLVTSSLLQLPTLLARETQVGVLTIDAACLSSAHVEAAGVTAGRIGDVVVQGVDPAGEFATCILGNRPAMDLARACADVVDAARALQRRAPQLRTVVLECTNMPPYAQAVRDATGLRTVSLADDPVLRGALG